MREYDDSLIVPYIDAESTFNKYGIYGYQDVQRVPHWTSATNNRYPPAFVFQQQTASGTKGTQELHVNSVLVVISPNSC